MRDARSFGAGRAQRGTPHLRSGPLRAAVRFLAVALALLSLVAIAAMASRAASAEVSADPGALVERAVVRFRADGTGTVRLRALLSSPEAFADFDPAVDGISVVLGPATLVDLAAGADDDPRRRRDGSWRLAAHGPGRTRARIALDPASGGLAVEARAADLAALRDAGPAGVELAIRAGSEERRRTLDFREASDRRWDFRDEPAAGDDPAPTGTDVRFEEIESGFLSQREGFAEVVITDDASWRALWEEHAPGSEPPAVDFENESVVGVFLGDRPTGGYAAGIRSIRECGDLLAVSWREDAPGPDCVNITMITRPWTLVRVPVPGATAAFEGSLEMHDCGR